MFPVTLHWIYKAHIFLPAKHSSLWKGLPVSELWILWYQWNFITQNEVICGKRLARENCESPGKNRTIKSFKKQSFGHSQGLSPCGLINWHIQMLAVLLVFRNTTQLPGSTQLHFIAEMIFSPCFRCTGCVPLCSTKSSQTRTAVEEGEREIGTERPDPKSHMQIKGKQQSLDFSLCFMICCRTFIKKISPIWNLLFVFVGSACSAIGFVEQ